MNQVYEIDEGRPFWKLRPMQLLVTIITLLLIVVIAVILVVSGPVTEAIGSALGFGAVIAIIVLVVASAGFALYVANFSNHDRIYGSFGGVIVFLLWLWLANCALLFGAEFDAELERGRQLQAGTEAEADIQLPPRDTRKSERAAEKEQ